MSKFRASGITRSAASATPGTPRRRSARRNIFDQVEARKYFVEYHIPGFAEFERVAREESLEIGCGIGTDTINFARAGAQITTVDLSEKSMELERRRAFFGLGDRIRFCPGNAEQLSAFVPVEPYDLIYSFGVIHHTPHPEAVLAQLWQYTQPGTTIKIMVYHRLLTEGRGILEAAGRSWCPKTPKLKPAAGDLYVLAAQQLAHGVLRRKMDS